MNDVVERLDKQIQNEFFLFKRHFDEMLSKSENGEMLPDSSFYQTHEYIVVLEKLFEIKTGIDPKQNYFAWNQFWLTNTDGCRDEIVRFGYKNTHIEFEHRPNTTMDF